MNVEIIGKRFRYKYDVIQTTNCWIWNGSFKSDGYGQQWVDGKWIKAHRLSWFLKYGVWSEQCICHKCDNPSCVNPDHLFEGTHQDNMTDMVNKGRSSNGFKNGQSFLTNSEIHSMKVDYKSGSFSQKDLASKYQCSRSHVCNIVNERRRA
jgi:hypothetical protein